MCFVLYIFRVPIFKYTGTKMGIVPSDKNIIEMASFETLDNEVFFNEEYRKKHGDIKAELLHKDNRTYEIVSIYKVKLITIKTIDGFKGLTNFAIVALDEMSSAPEGKIYKYPLDNILETRQYSKKLGVKFAIYSDFTKPSKPLTP
jgi:hypothetical protein